MVWYLEFQQCILELSGKTAAGDTSRIYLVTQHHVHTATTAAMPMGRQQLCSVKSSNAHFMEYFCQVLKKKRNHVVQSLAVNVASYKNDL